MTNVPQYFQVADFDAQQHYSDRRLLWIKLYNTLLDDPNFCVLCPLLRYILIGLMLLASRCNNRIPYDLKYLTHALHLDEQPDLTPLFSKGFLIATRKRSASKLLAARYQNAGLDKEKERDKEKDKKEEEKSVASTEAPAAKGKSGKSQKLAALEAFIVTDEIREWARKEFAVEIPDDVLSEFKAHWRVQTKLRDDWTATFKSRIRQLVGWKQLQPVKLNGAPKNNSVVAGLICEMAVTKGMIS